jgi:hypothetical protein
MLCGELRGKQVATITEWLASLGMSEYAQRFADTRIGDASILRDLTDQDLKDIGVPLGHRRKMLRVIAETVGAASTNPSQSRRTTQSGASSPSCSPTSSARPRFPREPDRSKG